MPDPFRFIAPVPRLWSDGVTWVSEVRRLEVMGFHSVAVSHHITHGWQLGLLVAMAFAAANTSRLRVLSLVAQNDLHHPALLAKDIATIDALSGGRVELGIGSGWLPEDYTTLGLRFERGPTRVAKLAEALEVIDRYFTGESVDFVGDYYCVNKMEALPRCVQRPRPPILIAAAGPRMLDLAGRTADIVGIHARLGGNATGPAAVADLSSDSIEAKIERVRAAAADAGRPAPRIQFSCLHVCVTDAPGYAGARSRWPGAAQVEAEPDSLKDSPAVLVGTAAECADKLVEWRERFGISYWHLGQDAEAASRIVERLRSD